MASFRTFQCNIQVSIGFLDSKSGRQDSFQAGSFQVGGLDQRVLKPTRGM